MKLIVAFVTLFYCLSSFAQSDTVVSKVYTWQELKEKKKDGVETRKIASGSGAALAYMNWSIITMNAGKSSSRLEKHSDEELIIIREGQLKVSVRDSSKLLGPGSIALFMPGDEHELQNTGTSAASYYVLQYRSKAHVDMDRGKRAGGSFMVDWNNIEFKPHGRGGIRNFFERPTAMLQRFEMHVTTLNAGIKSHDPHTHGAEEVVLLVSGNTEMQIAQSHQKANGGDLIYLSSNILHAIENIGKEPSTYFAFQWQ
jgi:(S)-ureidoglycine aminohydrolase